MITAGPGWAKTPALERWLNHASLGIVAISGFAIAVMKWLMTPADEFSVVGHPWQPHALTLHVVAAPAMMLAVGMLLREHVVPRLARRGYRRSRKTGITLSALFLPMAASGYLLQVSTSESWRLAWTIAHVATGTAYAGAHVLHLVSARRTARAAA